MDTPDGIVMFFVWLGSWGVLGVLVSGGGAQIWHPVNPHAEQDGCRLLAERVNEAALAVAAGAPIGRMRRRRRAWRPGGWRAEVGGWRCGPELPAG